VRLPKELSEAGFDAGAHSIRDAMATPGRDTPSVSTIYRVLRPGGFISPEPQATSQLVDALWAEFANECWQADVTHVVVAEGVVFEVLNIIEPSSLWHRHYDHRALSAAIAFST
jgi:hypothetical protein